MVGIEVLPDYAVGEKYINQTEFLNIEMANKIERAQNKK